jgi:hypothetical protein
MGTHPAVDAGDGLDVHLTEHLKKSIYGIRITQLALLIV